MRRLLALALFASTVFLGPEAAAAACAPAHPGGEWRSYGVDLSNSRNQTSEATIGTGEVAGLEAAWSASSVAMGGAGSFSSTPVIADGCVFVTTGGVGTLGASSLIGSVFAIDADTGEPVWRSDHEVLPSTVPGIFAPAVADGRVYVLVGNAVPYAVALDQTTGEQLWRTDFLDPIHVFGINASTVLFDGMLFVATFGVDSLTGSRPPFYILDAATGEILKKTYVIPEEDFADGLQSGGGMWGTAVVDTATKHAYVGTSNPYNKVKEHDRTNSIMKIDLDRERGTFGEVVGNYKGDVDYDPALYNTFQCQTLGELQVVFFSIFCGQEDVDFGASPNLFTTSSGRVLVGDLQKSGVYHAVDADTMEGVWKATDLAPPSAGGNASTSGFDDTSIYAITNENRLYAIDKDTGAIRWAAPVADTGSHYQPVTVANGIVYTPGNNGRFFAFDTASGAELLNAPIASGTASCTSTAGAGIAVARNTVYVACDTGSDGGGLLVAYR